MKSSLNKVVTLSLVSEQCSLITADNIHILTFSNNRITFFHNALTAVLFKHTVSCLAIQVELHIFNERMPS